MDWEAHAEGLRLGNQVFAVPAKGYAPNIDKTTRDTLGLHEGAL